MVKIYHLSEKKVLYPLAAYWAFINWYLPRNLPFTILLNDYKRRAEGESFPYTYLAFIDDIPAGMATLKKADLLSRKDLYPWLSALYVAPEFRNRGIANALINHIINKSQIEGYEKLHLFIDNRYLEKLERYYIKRGWKYLDSSPGPENEISKIYSYNL